MVIVALISLSTTVFAASDVKIAIDGSLVEFTESSGKPFIDSANRTQVPLRVTMEAYGCTVEWDNSTRTAIVTKDLTTVQVPIGINFILVNGKQVAIDTVAIIKNSRTYLPIRAVLEAFGATVTWDNNTRTVEIAKK